MRRSSSFEQSAERSEPFAWQFRELTQFFLLILVRLVVAPVCDLAESGNRHRSMHEIPVINAEDRTVREQLIEECRYLAFFLSEQTMSIVCEGSAQHGADIERDQIAMIRNPFLVSREPLGANIFSRTAFDQFFHALGFSCSRIGRD